MRYTNTGYRSESRYSSRWEKPAGEVSLAKGAGLLIVLFILAALLCVALSGA